MLDKKFNDNCVDTYNQVIYNKSKYLWERIELMVKKLTAVLLTMCMAVSLLPMFA